MDACGVDVAHPVAHAGQLMPAVAHAEAAQLLDRTCDAASSADAQACAAFPDGLCNEHQQQLLGQQAFQAELPTSTQCTWDSSQGWPASALAIHSLEDQKQVQELAEQCLANLGSYGGIPLLALPPGLDSEGWDAANMAVGASPFAPLLLPQDGLASCVPGLGLPGAGYHGGHSGDQEAICTEADTPSRKRKQRDTISAELRSLFNTSVHDVPRTHAAAERSASITSSSPRALGSSPRAERLPSLPKPPPPPPLARPSSAAFAIALVSPEPVPRCNRPPAVRIDASYVLPLPRDLSSAWDAEAREEGSSSGGEADGMQPVRARSARQVQRQQQMVKKQQREEQRMMEEQQQIEAKLAKVQAARDAKERERREREMVLNPIKPEVAVAKEEGHEVMSPRPCSAGGTPNRQRRVYAPRAHNRLPAIQLTGPPVGYMALAIVCVPPPDELPRLAPGIKSEPSRLAAEPPRTAACIVLPPLIPPPPPPLAASRVNPAGGAQHSVARPILGVELVRPEPAGLTDKQPVVVLANRYRPLNRRLYANVSVVARGIPDLVPGDDTRSMLRWLRGCAARQACEDYDVPLHTSHEYRYREFAVRARRCVQQWELHPEDPAASPSCCPGTRPPDPSERLAALLVQQALAQRRSERERAAPRQVYDPSPHISSGRKDITPRLLLGEEFQATVPPLIEKPSELSAAELAVLGQLVCQAVEEPEVNNQGKKNRTNGRAADCLQGVFPPSSQAIAIKARKKLSTEDDLQQRHYIMDATVKELDRKLGELGKILGMTCMGSKTKALWVDKDERAFAAGVTQHDREFELIQRDYLPHKTMSQLIAYYYNVWKIRYTTSAAEWHVERKARKELMPPPGQEEGLPSESEEEEELDSS